MITPIEAGEGLLCVPHRLLGRTITVSCVSDEIRPVSWALMRKYRWVGDHLKVLVLLTKILVLDHKFADRGLLGEI